MRALAGAGITTPFPIQAATIPDAVAGFDVLGKARTGSGKTLGFGLPVLARLAETGRPRAHKPHAIVLVPTRELAIQVHDALEPLAHTMEVSLKLVAGGLSMPKQIAALERGVKLVIATPGRLADLVRRGHADTSATQIVVLDEADHMAEMGFMTEIEEILADVPSDAQHLLFSATLDGDVDRLIDEHMNEPVLHDVTTGDDAAMRHVVFNIAPHLKYEVSLRIAARRGRTIVFVRTKMACDRVAEQMRSAGVNAIALHGDKEQNERNTAIAAFKSGRAPVLVATDVAARGLHIEDVDLVLQLDPPSDFKDYTHRAGRTARAGAEGLVVTLALPHQRKAMDRIVDATGIEPLFRKVREADAETLAMIDALTGAREPSGAPVTDARGGQRGTRHDTDHDTRRTSDRTRGGERRGEHGTTAPRRDRNDDRRDRQRGDSAGGSARGDSARGDRKAPTRGAGDPRRATRGRDEEPRERQSGGAGRNGGRSASGRSSTAGGAPNRQHPPGSDERAGSSGRERKPNPNPRKKAPGTKKSAPPPPRGRKGKPRPKKKR
ncbi:DEAD/DEAH box helicase [Demequina sp. NBRC 110055]|uniref:DEAD/DEAH box helicase n=1 Tax=Demequina sp. NBRC 110055 TaxID=1570344 RepID=UPI0009FE3615|nr:DEAD/DEAH box helicase [Demequina sp. NBRC 110055]